MKVAAFVLLLAVAGLLVVGAVDAREYGKKHTDKLVVAAAFANADAYAEGQIAVTCTDTDTVAIAGKKSAVAASSSESASVAVNLPSKDKKCDKKCHRC